MLVHTPETAQVAQEIEKLNLALKNLSSTEQVHAIKDFFAGKPQLKNALAVRLLDDTDMYGQTIIDDVTQDSLEGKTRHFYKSILMFGNLQALVLYLYGKMKRKYHMSYWSITKIKTNVMMRIKQEIQLIAGVYQKVSCILNLVST